MVVDRFAVVEEEDALVPRNRDHDAEAEFLREIEEPARRRVVNPEHVHAEFAHQAEIERDPLRRGQVRAAFGRGPERAVGHALEIKLVFAFKEKLRPHLQAGEISRGDGRHGNDIMHSAEFLRGGHLRQDRNQGLFGGAPVAEKGIAHWMTAAFLADHLQMFEERVVVIEPTLDVAQSLWSLVRWVI